MPVTDKHVDKIIEDTNDEGRPKLHLAPTADALSGAPSMWLDVLSSPDPRVGVIERIWEPLAHQLPRTIKVLKRCLQGVGLLVTKSNPASIIYFLTLDDGEPHYYRGFPPASKLTAQAKKLPRDFLEFYQVHDGWVDQFESMGPMPMSEMTLLGTDSPSNKFLVTLYGSGGALIGYDLRESPPLCYFLPAGESPPEVVPNVWTKIDKWIMDRSSGLLPYKSR